MTVFVTCHTTTVLIKKTLHPLDKSLLVCSAESLDGSLTPQSLGTTFRILPPHEFSRPSRTHVLRALARVVLPHATIHISRDARVERPIGAEQHVYRPLHHEHKYGIGTKWRRRESNPRVRTFSKPLSSRPLARFILGQPRIEQPSVRFSPHLVSGSVSP